MGGFFKKVLPKPKDLIKGQKKFLTASPKDKFRSIVAPVKALGKGDIGGALGYGITGSILQAEDKAKEARASNIRRTDAAQMQRDFFSQQPMMQQPQSIAPITPPSYGMLDDYLARINGGPSAYAPPPPVPQMQPFQPQMPPGQSMPGQPGLPPGVIPFQPLPRRVFR